MSVTKILFAVSALAALTDSSYGQTFVGIDFEQLAAPSGCIRNATVPPTNVPSIPALKLPGATISGGQVLEYQNPFQFTPNNVYYTLNSCAGVQPAITINFDVPASQVNMVVGNIWQGAETLQVTDDAGDNQTVQLSSSNIAGQSIFLSGTGIHTITLSLPSGLWSQSTPAGFYIDNLDFYLSGTLNFVDPVPELMSGASLVTDPESLATLGTLVKAVAADGVARVLLTAQAARVGEMITFSIINDNGNPSNSVQADGGISTVAGSSNAKQQSVRVAAQDSTEGPIAFAVYYPPSDFSRGSQDDQAASRIVQIQVDYQGGAAATYKRPLTIVRPPVVLVHDLWEEPANWDTFTAVVNDARFFVRRGSYNNVLGSRITASIPVYQAGNLSHARESSLGMNYNAPLLETQIAQFISEFRLLENAAAAQADVVVHGMGGDIARASVLLPNYEAPESFDQGNVNKMITIGTAHLGTPLANNLLANNNSCLANILASAGQFSFSSATVDNTAVSGGIGDLQGNGFGGGLSPALAQIQNGNDSVPVAPISALMTNLNTNSLGTGGTSGFIRSACAGSPLASSLTALGWTVLFLEPTDGMVPLTSELAGTFGIPVFGIAHSAALEHLGFTAPAELDSQAVIGTTVIGLLNASARGIAFHPLP